MWSKTYSKKVHGITAQEIWDVWVDINQWHIWQDDIEYAKLEGTFKIGTSFRFKPKGWKEVSIQLVEVEPNKCFTDLTRFPLAKMYGIHEFIMNNDELEIKTTIKVVGLLSFIWRKLVAEKVANDEEHQTQKLIERVLELRKK